MNKKLILLIITGIVILASVLRLWQLGNVPISPDWDEAALGYSAYSILHTGKDEFGKILPVVLRSFDDYKPAFYAYLTVPSIAVFGLNIFAVRLPSAIFGILSVIATYFLVNELFSIGSKDPRSKTYEPIALFSAFLMAISPWSIQFSRVAFESNVADVLNIFAVLLFLKGLKKPWYLSISAIFAAISIYTYQSEKVFIPLLAIVLFMIFRNTIFKINKKYIFAAVVMGIIVASPMLFYLITDKSALLRAKGTSIFNYQTELLKTDIQNLERDKQNNDKLGQILDNRRIIYTKTIINGYLSHFDLNWLFLSGDGQRHHAPNMGLLYLFELPLILLGVYYLIFGNFDKKTKLLIFGWLLIAPIPASITKDVPHAVRTLNFLPIWQILAAIGTVSAVMKIYKLQTANYKLMLWKLFVIFYILFAVFNITYYLNQYFVQQNYYFAKNWQYGYKQAIEEVNIIGNKYKHIVVSSIEPLDQSYMFFLFYLKIDPAIYQNLKQNVSGGFSAQHKFGKYEFRPIDWKKDALGKDTLYVVGQKEIPSDVVAKKVIYFPDGTVAIKLIGT